MTYGMDLGTDLDQALEGNVLYALNFEKAVRDVLHWLRKEQTTFNRYLDNHPSIRHTAVTTFQGIIRTVPLPSPASTPCIDDHHVEDAPSPASDPKKILRREQLRYTRRAGLRESPVPPEDLPIDEGEGAEGEGDKEKCDEGEGDKEEFDQEECDDRLGYDSGGQHEVQRRSYTLSNPGTPASTHLSYDSNLEHNPVYLVAEQACHHLEPPHQTEVEGERDAEDEQAGHDVRQEEPYRDLNALQPVLDGQSVAGRSVAIPPATPSTSGELKPASPTNLRASKRKRKSGSREGQHSEQGEKLGQGSPCPDPLPVTVTRRIPGIASFETIVFLWDRLQLLSHSTSGIGQSLIYDDQSPEASMQVLPRRQRLEMLWSRIGDNARDERWARVLRRICQAEFFGQYLEERARFDRWRAGLAKRCRTGRRGKEMDASPPSHPLEEYVDLCFPETILQAGDDPSEEAMLARSKAKKKFDNLLRKNEPWVRLNQRFGKGVVAVAPDDLRDEHLRKLNKNQFDPLLDLINDSKPCLREHLGSLTDLLSVLIEHDRLPVYKLQLQMLSRDQLESMRSEDWSLKELLEPCPQYEGKAPDSGISPNECPIGDYEGEAPDSGTSLYECPINDDYEREAHDSGTSSNGCPIIGDYEGEAPDPGTSANKCPINDDGINQEDWSSYVNLPPDSDLSAQSMSLLPVPPPLLHSARTIPDAHMRSTQICEQDSPTQLVSHVSNCTDVDGSLPESFLDHFYLSSPLVLPPCSPLL